MSWATPHLLRLEKKYRIPPGLLGAMMRAESGGQKYVRSSAGAIGPMQLMPGTAAGLGVDPMDPVQNLEGGAKYMRQLLDRFHGDVVKMIAGYNAGPGAVEQYGGVPPYSETRNHVKKVQAYWRQSSRYGQPASSGSTRAPARGAQQQAPTTSSVVTPPPVVIPKVPLLPKPVPQEVPAVYEVDPARIAKIQHAWSDAPQNAGLRIDREYQQQDDTMQKASIVTNANDRAENEWRIANMINQDRAEQEAIRKAWAERPVIQSSSPAASPTGNSRPSPGGVGDRPEKAGAGWYRTPNGWVQAQRDGEQSWRFLQRLGGRGFGLENDPGDNQTTGGRHMPNSPHYSGLAIDYGNGRNNVGLLDKWYKWLDQRRRPLNIAQLLLEDPGTSNHHVHVALSS